MKRKEVTENPVSITGIAGRFPESNNIDEFWTNLLSGRELCTEDDRRWPVGYKKLPKKAGKIPTITKFDADFFCVDSRKADEMDPQFRICHETTFEAILDGGLDPASLRSNRTGMFIGFCYSDSWLAQTEDASMYDSEWIEAFSEVSKYFGFKGPCTTHDSACASSFSAFNEAVKLIEANVIDTAIVSGVGICSSPFSASAFMQLGMTSSEGRSRCMDLNASGYVRSETIGSIILQRRSEAKRIYACVVNTGTNSDGYKMEGITFPGQESMERLMAETYKEAGLDPKDTKYIEGHVTGTQAGDPVECKAIESVFCPNDRNGPVLIGCLKSNMGHAEGSSGIAAITKACLIIQRNIIPANILFSTPNPNIPGLFNGNIKPVLQVTPFPGNVISLNSFGFGGSNIHVIIRANESANENVDEIGGILNFTPPGEDKNNGRSLKRMPSSGTLINRLILYKARTEEGFNRLKIQLQNNPDQITTEFLALIDNIARLDSSFDLPYRGYFILDVNSKKVIKSAWSRSQSSKLASPQDSASDAEHEGPEGKCLRKKKFIILESDASSNLASQNLALNGFKSFLSSVGLSVFSDKIDKNDNIMKTLIGSADLESADVINLDAIKSADDVLSTIGNLYMNGHDEIRISSLYRKVAFPVSKTTASISPLLTWRHDVDRRVFLVPEYFRYATNNKNFHFDYAGNFEYLSGHVIDGRILFPASGYLWIVWHSLALELIENSPEAYFKSGIEFRNVKLHRASIVNKNDELTLRTSLNSLTGSFEVTQNDAILVTGHARLTYDQDVPFPRHQGRKNDENIYDRDGDVEKIPGKDFYKELRVRGYDYEGAFQGVTSSLVDGTGGRVNFIKHWICFCDAIFQLSLLNDRTRQLLLPTGFDHLQVSLAVFEKLSKLSSPGGATTEMIDGKEVEKGSFGVIIDPATKELFAEGLYVKGMKADAAPRKKVAPLVRKFQYRPFDETLEENTLAQKKLAEYSDQILALLESTTDAKQIASDANQEEEDLEKTLLSVIKKLKFENEEITPEKFLKHKETLSSDQLIQLPKDNIAFDHQLDVVVSTFHGRKLNVNEINLSTKSSVEEEVKKSIIYTCPEVNYNTIPDYANEIKSKKSKIDAQLVIIQHPTLGFAFLDEDPKDSVCGDAQDSVCGDAIKMASEQMNPENFLLVIMRSGTIPIEDKISKLIGIQRRQKQSADEVASLIKSSGLTLISKKVVGKFSYFLARKMDVSQTLKEKSNIIDASSFDYTWVEEVRDKMYSKDGTKSEDEKFYLIGRDCDTNGLIGLINCVKKEDNRFRGILILDPNANEEKVISRCINYDLIMTVYKNGKIGSFINSALSNEAPSLDALQSEANFGSGANSESADQSLASTNKTLILDVESKGDLSSLKYYESKLSDSGAICDVHYAALNFKDVMVASGRVPLTAYPEELGTDDRGDLGMEFSGIDTRGNRIMAFIISDAIATKVDVAECKDFIWNVPDWMNLEEAATIPVVYSTVYYALIMRGKLIPGESILIHAGSGGVGQAAINVCLSMGCEVFTTVGTEEKRQFIRKQFPTIDEDHIFDSRSVSFGDNLLIATNGRGVDVILNSLSEEKLQVGLTCLAENGRFIEIGKYDMVNNSLMDPSLLQRNQTFQAICLAFFMSKVASDKSSSNTEAAMLRHLMDEGLKRGVVKPLSRHVFEWNQAEEAFRFMATGKHVGKVLMRMRRQNGEPITASPGENSVISSKQKVSFDPKKSYLVIGGLGGFGLEICHWLVKKGVRLLIITSRSGAKTSYQRFCINRMKNFGAKVDVVNYDVSDANQAEQLIAHASKIAPVGGIFNLGMVLRDSLFENQSKEMFEQTCAIKIQGTTNLDTITRRACPELDHFVCFSSLVSSIGNPGQSNYAFANSFMELLCEKRKMAALPGLAIGWGAIGDVGHVAENIGHDVIIAGSIPQRIISCLEVMEEIIYAHDPIIGSLIPAINQSSSSSDSDLLTGILNVLGIKDQSKIDASATLGDLGLDSLMAVEIKQILEKKYDIIYSTKEIRDLKIDLIRSFSKGGGVSNNQGGVSNVNQDKSKSADSELKDLITFNLPSDLFQKLVPNQHIDADAEPIFIIPPIEGTFVNMMTMVETLSQKIKRPLIGINWVNENDTHDSVQQMASFYLKKLQESYPHLQEFDIIGYSLGSLVALEMAIQSQGGATRIRRLLILDFSPSYGRSLLLDNTESRGSTWLDIVLNYVSKSIRLGTIKFDEKITRIPNDDEDIVRLAMLVRIQSESKISDGVFIDSIDRIRRKIRMVKDYQPNEKLNQDVMLIRATSGFTSLTNQVTNHDYDLNKYVSGIVSVVKFDGDHKSFLSMNHDLIAYEIMKFL